jgi:tetratricopeptide (TPR) repeat protein
MTAPAARVVLGDAAMAHSSSGLDGSSAGLERSFSPGAGPWTFQIRAADFAIHLEQAYQAYRRVVEVDSRAAEARVRLGRVECARGSCGSGTRNMRAGAELAGGDAVIGYYAAMFLGQAEEARGKHEEARQAYERAAALFPLAQSPLLALGALADRTGDRPAAARLASTLWSLPAGLDRRHDPWWDYDGGPRDGEVLLWQAYRLMDGGVDDRR